MKDFSVLLEPGFPQSIVDGLSRCGHKIKYAPSSEAFGGAQLIVRAGNVYVGGSDHRKEGMAAGF